MIGVVGGGIAGLVAARELRERGYEVRVFEASRELGGLAASLKTTGALAGDESEGSPERSSDGAPVERLPLTFSPADDAVAALADDVGLADRLRTLPVRTGYYVDGVAHPRTRLSEKLAFPRLNLQDKCFESLLARGVSLGPLGPPSYAVEDPERYDDVSARAFVDEHATASVREQVVEPRLRGAFGDSADDVSAAWLLGDLARRRAGRTWRTDSVVYPEGGVATLVDALLAGVGRENVSLGARVVRVETERGDAGAPDETGFVWNDAGDGAGSDAQADGGRESEAGNDRDAAATGRVERLVVERDGDRAAVDVDAAVFATPPRALERATDVEWTGETRGLLCTLFGLSESLLDTYDLTVVDDAPFARLVEHTNLVDPDRFGGDRLLYAVAPVSNPRDDRWQLDDHALARRWAAALEELFPQFDRERVRWSSVTRVRDAGPVYRTGYRERAIPHDLADAVGEGCFYAGHACEAQYPNWTVDGAVRAGRRCAELVAASNDGE